MEINFDKGQGLVPAIVQDSQTHQVLMLGYMNEEAHKETVRTQKVTFFSRSKQRLWTKGERSGNYLELVSMTIDCDGDTLLVKANPLGPTCHLGTVSCFADDKASSLGFLGKLQAIIKARKEHPIPGSYTASLFADGINKIAQKVGEEGVEVVIEAITQNNNRLKEESADLLFHLMVLLESREVPLEEVVSVLQDRHQD